MLNHPSFIKTEEPQTYPLVSRTPFKKTQTIPIYSFILSCCLQVMKEMCCELPLVATWGKLTCNQVMKRHQARMLQSGCP
jgi:hypothetical protein